jgi:hypothetical protein
MYGLILYALLAQPAEEPAAAGDLPPQQVLASIDARGNLTITQVACACPGEFVVPPPAAAVEVPEGEKSAPKAKPKVKVTNLMVTITEMPAKDVKAFTVEGREVTAEKLATLLAKERAVLVALGGKKVDPFHLQLYKEDTLVLVPPPGTMGGGGFGGWGYGGVHAVYQPAPVAVPVAPPVAVPLKRPKKDPDEGR